MEKYKILTKDNFAYKDIFLCRKVQECFCPVFKTTKQDFLKELSCDMLPDAVLLDIDCVAPDAVSLIKEAKEVLDKNPEAQTKKQEFPFIFVNKGITEKQQIDLFEAGATVIMTMPKSAELFVYKLSRLLQKSRVNEIRIATLEMLLKTEVNWRTKINTTTGIYNEETFIKQTRLLLKENPTKKYMLLRFDIDRFKLFNEIFGFERGNDLLEYIGDGFRDTEKKGTTYGHLYADNFIVCLEQKTLSPDEVCKKIEGFLQKFEKNFEFTVRGGIYLLDDTSIDLATACDRTLLALQSAKKNYNNRVAYYTDDMLSYLKDEQALISDMSNAIKNEDFVVYFQPQYDYSQNTLIGAEALVRWVHPQKGLIPPGVFIPLFEGNGFITQLDEYVWDKTCSYIRAWLDRGLKPVPVSVNISRRDIYQADLVGILVRLLGKYKLSPEHLRLEITESATTDDPDTFIKVIEKLRNVGFCVEMDDFGSGYSSLNTLKDMPIDIIKLDMKFIMDATAHIAAGIGDTSKSGIILNSVINMASWLQMPIIAEGIETKEQADYLKSIGCFNMQGYYFAKPMNAASYENLLAKTKS